MSAAKPSTDHPIRCRCGHLRGTLSAAAPAIRFTCYCCDCQAYAHALGGAGQVLDAQGGTDVVVTLLPAIRLTEGADALACLSLSKQGTLRWYASCCDTPLVNTARTPKFAYAGLVHASLAESPAALDTAYGQVSIPVNTQSLGDPPQGRPLRLAGAVMRLGTALLTARVGGAWRRTPFFREADAAPVVATRVLTPEERRRAYAAVDGATG